MDIYKIITFLIFWCFIHKGSSQNFQCNSSEACYCSSVSDYYEYICPSDEERIVLQVRPKFYVFLQCIPDQLNWSDQKLPKLNLEKIETFRFRKCPIPNNISNIINTSGVQEVKELKFDYVKGVQNLSVDMFSGLSYLENLTLSHNDIENIDEDTFKHLTNLISIDLSGNSIRLTANLFKYTKKLFRIDLAQNNIESIPEKLFNNLTNLEVLLLWSNNISTINGNVFHGLINLKLLELSYNNIQHFSHNAFHSLQNLNVISLEYNKFETVPEGLFARNPELEVIKMQRNSFLRVLPNYLFANLTNLKNVQLFECNLLELPENLFAGSAYLKKISFKRNKLKTLPKDVFRDLGELENLDLSENDIESLPDSIFYCMMSLQTLNLANNKLTGINENFLYDLLSLETINIGHNRISSIHREAFKRLIELKNMDLSYNYLVLPEDFTNVTPFNGNFKLENVDLSHNNITSISEDWMFSKVKLQKLDFSYNQIDYLNFNILMSASYRITLNLSHNKIRVVNFTDAEILARGQDTSNTANTVVLLDDNPIECDCHIYDFVRYFKLDLNPMVPTLVTIKADNLKCQPPLNDFLVKDLQLNMMRCALGQLENSMKCPYNCECVVRPLDKALIVNCSDANLTSVPQLVFPKSVHFNHLEVHLANNNITTGPSMNMGYEHATILNLSSNRIDKFEWIPPNLKTLILDNNNVRSLNDEVFEMVNRSMLTNISLGNNPWNCDCYTANFTQFLLTHSPQQQIDVKNIKCSNSGEMLVQLNIKELCENDGIFTVILGVSIALIALLVAIITILYYRYELEIKVWLYAHNMLWLISEEEIDKDKLYDAFISYSHQDEDFLMNDLLPVLEQGPKPYKLCIHIRDWIAGEFIPTQILNSVENSRRTIVILSPSFLQSCWGKMEFNMAHTKSVADGRCRVIVIVYGDVDLDKDLDDELKAYIKTNTYVKWGDPWFWDKLRYALPHSKIKMGRKSQNIMANMNNKLDLLNNIPCMPNSDTTPPTINMEPPLLVKDHPLNFRSKEILTPPAEDGITPSLIASTK